MQKKVKGRHWTINQAPSNWHLLIPARIRITAFQCIGVRLHRCASRFVLACSTNDLYSSDLLENQTQKMANIGLSTALNRQPSANSRAQVSNQRAPDCAPLAKPLCQQLVFKWSDHTTVTVCLLNAFNKQHVSAELQTYSAGGTYVEKMAFDEFLSPGEASQNWSSHK